MPTVARWRNDRPQYFTDGGLPLAGGKIYFYEAGTTTPRDTYTTSAGSVANANPVVLDSYGRPTTEIWLDVTYDYKAVLKTSADVTIWTEDNVQPVDTASSSVFVDDEFQVTGSADPTRIMVFQVDGLTTATTRTLTIQDKSGSIAVTSEFDYSNTDGSPGRMPLPPMYIQGLIISNDAGDVTNDVAISAGMCRDATDAHNLILTATLTKKIDAAWAVGDDQGGLDGSESVTGTPDISTWYYVWLIKRSDTGVVDALFSESSSAPSMPTSYDYKRLIGAVYNDASGNIVAFSAVETEGGGLRVLYTTSILDIDLANTLTTSRRTDVISVPLLSLSAHIRAHAWDATTGGSAVVCGTQETDAAPTSSAAPLANLRWSSAGGMRSVAEFAVHLPAADATLASRATLATVDEYQIVTLGWTWGRR